MYFTFAKTTDDSVFYTTSFGDYRQETLDSMKQSSTYFNDLVNTDQKFVSLSTCDLDYGFDSSHRFVLTGQLEKTSDDIVLKRLIYDILGEVFNMKICFL